MKQNLTNVLWLNNNKLLTDEIIKTAVDEGLNIETFYCWDELFKNLQDKYDYWGAIIIEPYSKLHPNSLQKPQILLPKAFCDISSISAKKGKPIPWYIFTSKDPNGFIELIIEDRKIFDKSWPKGYYEFGIDDKDLLERIKATTQESSIAYVRNKYENLFNDLAYLEDNNLSSYATQKMEALLINTEFDKGNCDFNDARKVIEYIFDSMIQNGALPDFKNSSNDVNISSCSRLLSCLDVRCDWNTTCKPKFNKSIMPSLLAKNVFYVLSRGNEGSHAKTREIQELDEYNESIPSNYLLKVCTYKLCDTITWYAKFIRQQVNDYGKVVQWWDYIYN